MVRLPHGVHLPIVHALLPDDSQTLLDAVDAVRDLSEVVLADRFLKFSFYFQKQKKEHLLDAECSMIAGAGMQLAARQHLHELGRLHRVGAQGRRLNDGRM